MFDWTGHALVDVGIAALCAMTSKRNPASLTTADLDAATNEMERYYFSGVLSSYLTCVFMNSEYVQPGSGAKKNQSRKRYADRILRAYRAEPGEEAKGQVCIFSGMPATHLIHRGQMPLLTGEGVLNFFPSAAGGLFIAGRYLTALQALPLGGRRCEGKLLVAHSDNPELTLLLAKRFVEDNRRLLALAISSALPNHEGADANLEREQASWDAAKKRAKYPDAKSAFTLIASDVVEILQQRRQGVNLESPCSLQVYWLSSSGQGPSLDIFTVPSALVRFLDKVGRASTGRTWERVLARGWRTETQDQARPAKRGKGSGAVVLVGPGRSRNAVLTDLLAVYADGFVDGGRAQQFVRRHLFWGFTPTVERFADCTWELADMFLEEVLGMSPDRIGRIREFADRIAAYVEDRNDISFFNAITRARYPSILRGELVKAQRRESRRGLLFSLDQYLAVFEGEDGAGVTEWSLIRDLISIRLVEQLYKSGWLTADKLSDEAAEEQDREPTPKGE
jgi:CRISPR-associated protein Cst1